MNKIRQFFRNCHNVLRWLPVIWKDRDWDDQYIVYILIKKLEHQRDFFLSDKAYAANAKETAQQIQTAIDKLNRTADSWEFYECPVMEELDKKWGEGVLSYSLVEGESDLYNVNINYDGVKTPEDEKQYSKEFREGIERARKQWMKDKQEAYKYLADHIDYWWD